MKVVLFGATGMVGSGALARCLSDSRVESVLVIGRSSCGVDHPKVQEILHTDFFRYDDLASAFVGVDACFFCLGVSSLGLNEASYTRLTYDLTLAAAGALVAASPQLTFCYVSGDGTDSSEAGTLMWARVKGRTENALRKLGFQGAYMFRPGFIHPDPGLRSKTWWYRAIYSVLRPLYPLLQRLAPTHVTTSGNLGRALIEVGLHGFPTPVLNSDDINRVGASLGSR